MQRQHFQRFFSSSTYAGKLAVLPKLERLPDRVTLTAEAVGEFFAQDTYHGKQVGLPSRTTTQGKLQGEASLTPAQFKAFFGQRIETPSHQEDPPSELPVPMVCSSNGPKPSGMKETPG